jgi:tRNA(fMet)-specific endonuclease VapC
MQYLLDTNTCIHAMRGERAVVAAMSALAPSDLAVSTISCYELYTGVEKCAEPNRERAKLDLLFRTIHPIVFDTAAAIASGRVRAILEARGEIIGPYDVLIAGHAIAYGLQLVSANTNEFARVSGLSVIDWKVANA